MNMNTPLHEAAAEAVQRAPATAEARLEEPGCLHTEHIKGSGR